MFETFEPHIDSSLSALGNTSNPLGNNSLNPLQPDLSGFGSQQLLGLADQKFIDTWQNQITPIQVSINTYNSVFESGNGLTARYYNNTDFTNLGLIRTDTQVNFNWGNGSPDTSIAPDTFSVRWNGQVQSLYSEDYTFYTQSDDGVRLWVNGQLLIDKWRNQGTTEYSGKISLEAGKLYDLQLDYYENGGQAVSKLLWSSDSQIKQIIPASQLYSTLPTPIATGTGNGLTSRYYNNTNFTDLGVIRTDAQINFDWGNGSPDVNIDKDTFSVISSGKIQPLYSEEYTFYTQSDDGAKLSINGQTIIEQWKNQGVTEYKGTITLEAGKLYDIEYKYYENGGQAVSKLLWSSDSQIKEIIPTSQLYSTLPTPYQTGFGTGLRGEYFDNKDLTNSKLVRTDATIDFNWGQGSPDPSIGKDTFSATWTGFVQPLYNEKYTFSTQSDDGVRVWVNDQIIIDKWQDQSTREYSGFINLEAGKLSKIRVDYYENSGEAVSKLFWSSDSQVKQIIPTSQLYKDNNQPLIGIIDTGFTSNNPDFDYSRFILGKDYIDSDNNPLINQGEGNEHGTHILGIIGAIKNNEIGIDGISNNSPIWLSRALGSGKWSTSLIEFVDRVKTSGYKNSVINFSFDLTQKNADGTITTRYELTPEERSALEYARQNHILIVTAAGNNGGVMSVLGQASQEFDNIITVGAVDGNNRADYSSYGNGLDILADGGTVENPEISTVGNGFGTMLGTSVAAAKVTGAVSLIWEQNPDLSYVQVKKILTETATDLYIPGWDKETGAGLLNIEKALELSTQITGEIHNPDPIYAPTTWSGEDVVIPTERAVAEQFSGNGKYYNWVSYQIKPGDTLSQIAIDTMGRGLPDYYMWIANRNGMSNPHYIVSGQWILIPQLTSPPEPPVINEPPTNPEPPVINEPPTNPEPPVPPETISIDDQFIDIYTNNSWLGNPKNQAINDNGFIKQNFDNGYLIWNGQKTIAYQYGTGNTFFIDTGNPHQSDAIDIRKQWKVEFWDNINLSGNPKWIQYEYPGNIEFHAGIGTPPRTLGIPADNFSARWTKTDNFEGGLYNFISEADDGVRVYIDGVKVIDKWAAIEPWSRRDGYVLIPEGEHNIVIEYFEAGGIAGQNFQLEKSDVIDNWNGELLPVGYDGTSVHGTYVRTYQRNGDIDELGYPLNNVHPWENGYTQDFDGGIEGRGAIMKSNANDNSYWVGGEVWQKFIAVGGARYLGYPTTDYIDINGGLDNIENNGGIVQYFTGNIGIPTKIWLSKYGAHPTWGAIGGKYEALGGANSFLGFPTSQETGIGNGWVQQNFENGYMLWHPQDGLTIYDTKAIDSLPPDSGNGSTGEWKVQFWDNRNLSGTPKWTMTQPAGELRFMAGSGAPVGTRGIPADNFSARWETNSYFEGGYYNFISNADDGMRIYVDGVLVNQKWAAINPWERHDAYIAIPEGNHHIRVDYFEQSHTAGITLRWEETDLLDNWQGDFRPVGYDGTSVHGTYVRTYQRNGDIDELGYPLNNVHPWENGYTQDFDGGIDGRGAIMKSNANDNSYWVGGEVWQEFLNRGGARYLGYPTTDYIDINGGLDNIDNGGGIVQHFSGNVGIPAKIWLSKHGAHPTWGAIGGKYEQLGAANSFLGYPTGGETGIGDGWVQQNFENGYMLWHPNHGAIAYDTKAVNSLPPDNNNGTTDKWHVQYWNNKNLTGESVWSEYIDSSEIRFHAGNGAPVGTRGVKEDNFSVRWTTTSYFDGGLYQFLNRSDDGIRVFVDNEIVIDKWRDSPFEYGYVFITVPQGYHDVRVEYFEHGGTAANTLSWVQVRNTNQWLGEYFNNTNLSGSPVQPEAQTYYPISFASLQSNNNSNENNNRSFNQYIPIDPLLGGSGFLDKNWGVGHESFIPIGNDKFSDRWLKVEHFEEPGVYEFTNLSDDGIRVWIDGNLVVDRWQDQGFIDHKFLVALDSGYHEIIVEHYENVGASAIKLTWDKVAGQPEIIAASIPPGYEKYIDVDNPYSARMVAWSQPWVAEYFNNTELVGAPVVTELVDTVIRNGQPSRSWREGINLNWGSSKPHSQVGSDNFSTRLTAHRYLADGTYKFKLQADDGVRLYINGEKVIDQWNNPPFGIYEQEITLSSGIHTFQIEHREYGGLAYINFDWDRLSTELEYQVGHHSQGNTYNQFLTAYQEIVDDLGRTFIGVPIGKVEIEYTFPQIRSPYQNIMPGVIYPSGIVQEFRGSEGKGALLNKFGSDEVSYIFGEIWELYQQGGGTDVFGYPLGSQKDLGNGAYELDLANGKIFYKPGMTNATYYEYFNGGLTIPADAWRGEYYNNRTWSGDPLVVRADSNSDQNLNKDWRSASPAPGIPADNFSVRWTSYQDFDRGTYRLTGTHDDDFRVTVNGQTPINKTGVGSNVKGYGTFTQSGQYLLELNYVEYGGLAVANFSHEKASDFIVGLDPNNNPNQRIIDTFWQQGGYERVGVPINDVHPWYGLVQDFRGGANGDGIIMRENNNSEPYYIYGDIWRVYKENNDVAGLGYPTSNVFDDGHGNTAQNFGYNRITRHPDGYTFVGGYVNGYRLGGDFFRVWNQYQLGTPTSGVINYGNGITYRYFNHPTLGQVSAVQSQYGTFPLIGGIRGYYVNVAGGLGGALGAPKSAEYIWNGKTRQDFAGGYILWNGSAVGYRPDGSLLFPPTNSGGGNGGGSGGGSGNGSQLSRNEIQTILYNFFAKYGQNWADQSFDEMWDRVGGESAQFPNGNFTSGDQWQVDMPSEIFDIYKDLSNTIFGTVNGVNTGYVYDQGYYNSYGKWHAGLDIQASQGTLVKAAIGGKVAWMNHNFIGINGDDGNHWVYGHLGTKYIQNGQRIEIGQQLARTDSENHLHLEVQHGHGYKQTLGAHGNQDWLHSVTISPIQAYWDFNKSSDNGNRFQGELNEALNRIGNSIISVVKSPEYINSDQGKGWIAKYRLSNGKEYLFGLQDGKNDGYWVHGDNLEEYLSLGGPYGSLGFPTNEETPFTSHTGASGLWQSFSGANGNARIHNSWITDNGGQRKYVGSVATWGSIGGLYENMGGANSWLGVPTKAEWHSPDGKTIWSRFERGWIANNKDTNQTEAFDFNSRPSWIKNAYEKEFLLYLQKDLSLSPIEFEFSGDTTWNISVDNFLEKYGNFIKLAALYYGVSGQAIVGIIQWEYDQNSFSREFDELAFKTVQITDTWPQLHGIGVSGTGWGKIHYTTAQELMEQNSGLFDMDNPNDNRKLARYLAAPFSAIDLIAQELRKASQAYSKYGFEIYNNPGILATLYRNGEKNGSYEERAKSRLQNNQYPQIETGEIDVNDLPLVEQKVTVMGKWLYDKVQKSDLISYQTFDGELEPYNYFS